MNRKKLMIIIAAVLVLAIIASLLLFFAPGDFRRSKWGMSISQVKARENLELKNEAPYSLAYTLDSLEGVQFNSTLFYKFDSETGELTHVNIGVETYGFEDKLATKLINAFEENYGEPDEYLEDEVVRDYTWNTKRTCINVKHLGSYLLVTYMEADKAAKTE